MSVHRLPAAVFVRAVVLLILMVLRDAGRHRPTRSTIRSSVERIGAPLGPMPAGDPSRRPSPTVVRFGAHPARRTALTVPAYIWTPVPLPAGTGLPFDRPCTPGSGTARTSPALRLTTEADHPTPASLACNMVGAGGRARASRRIPSGHRAERCPDPFDGRTDSRTDRPVPAGGPANGQDEQQHRSHEHGGETTVNGHVGLLASDFMADPGHRRSYNPLPRTSCGSNQM